MAESERRRIARPPASPRPTWAAKRFEVGDGAGMIAAHSQSATNTSNPSVLVAAGTARAQATRAGSPPKRG